MDAVQQANAGHPGTAMALAPLAYLIYTKHLRHNPADPALARPRPLRPLGRPRLHPPVRGAPPHGLRPAARRSSSASASGARSRPGHPEHGLTPGIETTTGPLGQGFANGVGFAVAERFLAERYNRPHHAVVDHHVYAICSDGDLMEGVSNEAASIAGQIGLGKLVYFYDDNRITIDGTTSLSFTAEDRGARLEAQGWHVQHVARRERPRRRSTPRSTRRRRRPRDRRMIVVRSAHRLSGPARDRHGEGARRPARRGRGGDDEGGDGLGSGAALRTSPTRSTRT